MLAAVAAYSTSGRSPLPPGEVVSCRAYGEPEVRIRVEIKDERREHPLVVEIEPEVIGAALLCYCKAQGIPLPKRAEKALQVLGDSVVLNITIRGQPAKGQSGATSGGERGPIAGG